MQDVLSYLKSHQAEMLMDLEQLVKAESPTLNKELVDNCGAVLTKLFETHLDLEPEVIHQTETGNHLRFSYGEGDSQILIIGHFDTVWEEGRLPFIIKDNKAYGPGTIDMKGGLIQTIWALKACKELGIQLNKKVIILCTSDHEGIASYTARPFIEEEGLRSDVVLVPEASVSNTGALKTERKGILRYTVTIQGVAAHSGNNHEDGISANVEMAKQILYLDSLTNYEKGTTVNIGIAHGGNSINVIPENAEMKLDIRVTSMEEAERINHLIYNIKPLMAGTSIHIDGGIVRPTMKKTEKTEMLFNLAKDCATELGFPLEQASVGGGSDGSFTAALGIPTLDGLGSVGAGPHAEYEHILIDQLPVRAALLSKMLSKIT
ncbi:M20 family metallopeptidase [Bacillus sp. UMB0728]|uniref:M20 family metallopeptidase n=1 Tax=Bacillus sp. UMB0728 TaxID=2066052 RepID=UPI000C75B61B|nr:M20 family metallopeptidase [Bacillus sp. UMB0728]PLR71057.1 peptidase M20 [Bacillus sp. UMB0728]